MTEDEVCAYLLSCRPIVVRKIGLDHADDAIQAAIVGYLDAARTRYIEHPRGYAYTILQRMIGAEIKECIQRRNKIVPIDSAFGTSSRDIDPERAAAQSEQGAAVRAGVRSLEKKAGEMVTRAFLRDEPAERTMRAMGLTETQYRLLKSRAKQALVKKMRRQAPPAKAA